MFKSKNLLILTSEYPDSENKIIGDPFVKSQVDLLAKYFKNVYVISVRPYFPQFLSKLLKFNLPNLKNYSYNNIKVYYPKIFDFPVDYFRKRRGDRYFKVVDKLIKKEKINFDLIHAHFTYPPGYVGVKLKEKYGKPLVVTAHGNDVRVPLTNYIQSFDNSFLKSILDKVVNEADVILTHHEELRDLLLQSYPLLKNNIVFLYKGIDLCRFNPFSKNIQKKASRLKKFFDIEDRFVVLFLARIDWDKDPLTFLEAAKSLRENKEIALIVVGDGPLLKKCFKEKKHCCMENLYIVGNKSDTEVWYAMADVFVALSPVENIWSTTLQEALVMGLPTIVTSAGYTSKILKNNADVLIIPPKHTKALVNTILKLKENKYIRKRLSQNALKWRNKFNNSKIVKEIVKIYNRLEIEKK